MSQLFDYDSNMWVPNTIMRIPSSPSTVRSTPAPETPVGGSLPFQRSPSVQEIGPNWGEIRNTPPAGGQIRPNSPYGGNRAFDPLSPTRMAQTDGQREFTQRGALSPDLSLYRSRQVVEHPSQPSVGPPPSSQFIRRGQPGPPPTQPAAQPRQSSTSGTRPTQQGVERYSSLLARDYPDATRGERYNWASEYARTGRMTDPGANSRR